MHPPHVGLAAIWPQQEEAVRASLAALGSDLLILAYTFTQTHTACTYVHTKTYRFSHSLGNREKKISYPDVVIRGVWAAQG